MNELIETLFKDFTVDGVSVPVSFLYYEGHGEPYITYMQTDADSSYSGDDELLGYADYYDFDIYSKGDYTNIVKSVKSLLKANDLYGSLADHPLTCSKLIQVTIIKHYVLRF